MISYPETSIDLLMLSLLDCSPPYSLFSEEGCKTKEKLEFYLVLWKKETQGLEIVTDMVANAANIFSLATKSSGLVATLASRFLYDLDFN